MSEEGDGLGTGAGDSGYGAMVQQSSGESMSAESPEAETDTEPRETTSSDPEPSGRQSQTTSTEQDTSTSSAGRSGQERAHERTSQDWSDRGQEILADSDATPIDYDLSTELDNGLPYVVGRTAAHDGLVNTGARVRPELHQALKTAYNDVERFYSDEDCVKADYYEAALTVALWHHDEVLAVMTELGYGLRE